MKQQCMLALLVFFTILCGQSDIASGADAAKLGFGQQCPLVKCIPCPNDDYVIDKRGCQTCECNPCRFGQPLYKYPCGEGTNACVANKGLCKVSTAGIAYCCPKGRPGRCPPGPPPGVAILCAQPTCNNDYDCAIGQKCCNPCSACANVTLY